MQNITSIPVFQTIRYYSNDSTILLDARKLYQHPSIAKHNQAISRHYTSKNLATDDSIRKPHAPVISCLEIFAVRNYQTCIVSLLVFFVGDACRSSVASPSAVGSGADLLGSSFLSVGTSVFSSLLIPSLSSDFFGSLIST